MPGNWKDSSISSLFFSHSEDFEEDGEEEEDKDSDSEDVKEEVSTPALASNALTFTVL